MDERREAEPQRLYLGDEAATESRVTHRSDRGICVKAIRVVERHDREPADGRSWFAVQEAYEFPGQAGSVDVVDQPGDLAREPAGASDKQALDHRPSPDETGGSRRIVSPLGHPSLMRASRPIGRCVPVEF
jgi:hypothetical protein